MDEKNIAKQIEQQQTEEALRAQVQRDIDAARVQIEAALALLNAHPYRDDLASQINALQSQLMQLDGLRMEASMGNIAQLAAMQVGVAVTVGTTQNLTSHVTSAAAVESYQSVMLMSHQEMAELERGHWAQSDQFQQFEVDMTARIDALAAANGVDMSAFHEKQRQLAREYEEAKARGDLAGMLEADALRATNVRTGLEEVGASQAEIDAAREQEEAAQKRYLDQSAIEARREAEAQGMSLEAAKEHVAAKVAGTDARLSDRKEEYARSRASNFESAFKEAGFEVADATEAASPLSTPSMPPAAEVEHGIS